jgi:hypothetical protein
MGIVYCDHCGSMECHGECKDYDFCEHCGSVGCKGECQKCPQCGKTGCSCPKENPGASLARKARQNQEALQRAMNQAIEARVYPPEPDLPNCTLEEFEAQLAKKRKPRIIYKDLDGGYTFRQKP